MPAATGVPIRTDDPPESGARQRRAEEPAASGWSAFVGLVRRIGSRFRRGAVGGG
jgi:hypothetical protein